MIYVVTKRSMNQNINPKVNVFLATIQDLIQRNLLLLINMLRNTQGHILLHFNFLKHPSISRCLLYWSYFETYFPGCISERERYQSYFSPLLVALTRSVQFSLKYLFAKVDFHQFFFLSNRKRFIEQERFSLNICTQPYLTFCNGQYKYYSHQTHIAFNSLTLCCTCRFI